MRIRIYGAALALCVTLFGNMAQAQLGGSGGGGQPVDWGSAPLACLPTRVVPWDGISRASACHCPPTSLCPAAAETIKPSDITIHATLDYTYTDPQTQDQNHAETTFVFSGTDLANYYGDQFVPANIFVLPDVGCPGGNNWGVIQDYLAPLIGQSNGNVFGMHDYNTCSQENESGGWIQENGSGGWIVLTGYKLEVKVSPEIAPQIISQTQPPALVSACCAGGGGGSFSCPTGTQIQLGSGNTISCEVISDQGRLGCLLKGTPITMADGSIKKVEEIKLGDKLKGNSGVVSLQAINQFTQYEDEMYSFNGGTAFITSEHPILTTHGWKSIHPEFTKSKSKIGNVGKLEVGDEIVTSKGTLKIQSIEKHAIHAPAIAYNLSVKGGDGFIANDIVVKGFSQVQVHY